MGVLTLQLLVCGQLILYSLVLINITDAQQNSVSPLTLITTIAPPLNATGNYTENNVSNSTSFSGYNNNTTAQNSLTTPATTVAFNSTLGPILSNVTGSAGQPNKTETAQTTQPATSSPSNITSTAAASTANTTHSSNGSATTSTTPVTKPTAVTSTAITQNSTTSLNESQGGGMNHSEKSLTVLFSVLLGVIVLVILVHFMYKFRRSKERSIQYTHRRLHNEDTGEPFAVPDDTLVISGGLYDGPQIYNPTMTVQNEDFQTDTSGFASRPTQFRLEFLREDQDREFDHETSTFETFHAHDQEP
ncbi:sialomucin core protein 24-like isoform X2 [Labeo rohita]|uniref:sialomucin core protein 24-like isoform X2 n=1 Tax=Labeo rohita TaxID=84645 RepID=UPI0021E1E8F6|nr:sialomucin core protein 24-like isoform X2 [Labeo rohita]